MKPSHLTTPRTLAECQFTTGYTSADTRSRSYHPLAWLGALWLCAIVAVLIVLDTR